MMPPAAPAYPRARAALTAPAAAPCSFRWSAGAGRRTASKHASDAAQAIEYGNVPRRRRRCEVAHRAPPARDAFCRAVSSAVAADGARDFLRGAGQGHTPEARPRHGAAGLRVTPERAHERAALSASLLWRDHVLATRLKVRPRAATAPRRPARPRRPTVPHALPYVHGTLLPSDISRAADRFLKY